MYHSIREAPHEIESHSVTGGLPCLPAHIKPRTRIPVVSAAARRSLKISRYSGDITQAVNVSRSGKAMRTTLSPSHRPSVTSGCSSAASSRPPYLMRIRHECSDVPLVPGAIVNGELGYCVYRHRATVPVARAASSCTGERHCAVVRRPNGYRIRLLYGGRLGAVHQWCHPPR